MADNGGKWQKMVENGRKWSKKFTAVIWQEMVFSRVSRRGHRGGQVGNGRKWQKMAENGGKKDHRGYLVGNGFSRVLRLFPTTQYKEVINLKQKSWQ